MVSSKVCKYCQVEKDLSQFHNSKVSSDGKNKYCVDCVTIPKSGNTSAPVRKLRLIDDQGRECIVCSKYKTWNNYAKNSGNTTGYMNRCKPCANELKKIQLKKSKYKQRRESRDVAYKLRERVRNRIRDCFRHLKTYDKPGSFTKSLGCTNQEFRNYIESKFQPGMSWDNYGFGVDKWHIDHIRPLSSFNMLDPEEFKQACHYTNTQPLWQTDNFKKSDKWNQNEGT